MKHFAEKIIQVVLADGTHRFAASNSGFTAKVIDGQMVVRPVAGKMLVRGKYRIPEIIVPLRDVVKVQFDQWDKRTQKTYAVLDVIYHHGPDGTYTVHLDTTRTTIAHTKKPGFGV